MSAMSSVYKKGKHKEAKTAKAPEIVILHKPCAWNPNGVSEHVCMSLTRVAMRNIQGCFASKCASPKRICRVCVRRGAPLYFVADPETGLCAEHRENPLPPPVRLVAAKPVVQHVVITPPAPPVMPQVMPVVESVEKSAVEPELPETENAKPVKAKIPRKQVSYDIKREPGTRAYARAQAIRERADGKFASNPKERPPKKPPNPLRTLHMRQRIRPIELHVGQRILEARKAKNLSQYALGMALGVTHRQIGYYERGMSAIDTARLYTLSVALCVPIGFFFEGFEQTV